MGLFDGIDNVSSNQGGNWLKEGKHRLRINALKMPQGLHTGDNFIAELTVVKSTSMEAGSTVSWVRNITKHKDMALADIKAFLAAAAGVDEETVTKAGAMAAVGEDQPLAGKMIECEAFQRPTKSGGEFTRTLWSAAEA